MDLSLRLAKGTAGTIRTEAGAAARHCATRSTVPSVTARRTPWRASSASASRISASPVAGARIGRSQAPSTDGSKPACGSSVGTACTWSPGQAGVPGGSSSG